MSATGDELPPGTAEQPEPARVESGRVESGRVESGQGEPGRLEPDDTVVLGAADALSRAPGVADDEPDRTVVVDRVAHSPSGLSAFEPAEADHIEADHTVVIPPDRERPTGMGDESPPADVPIVEPSPPGRAKRVRITLPDDTQASRRAADGSGVGARDRYRPRAIPSPPTLERLPAGPAATRTAAPAMPSVARASRRAGRWALGMTVLACVVAVVGLVVLGILIVGG